MGADYAIEGRETRRRRINTRRNVMKSQFNVTTRPDLLMNEIERLELALKIERSFKESYFQSLNDLMKKHPMNAIT